MSPFQIVAAVMCLAALVFTAPDAPRGVSTQRQPDTLYVGSTRLQAHDVVRDSSAWIVTVPDSTAPAGEREIGRLSHSQRTDAAHATLYRISHFVGPKSEVTDSVETRVAGLVPVSEISHQTSKLMRLRFDGRHVTGEVTPAGKTAEAIAQTMAVPPFNSSDVELVIQSLRLAPGSTTLLATYEYESGGLRLDTLTVLDRGAVRVSRGAGSFMTVWLDPSTRRILREEYGSREKGWTMRIRREPHD